VSIVQKGEEPMQLITPSPDQALAGLRAMRTIADAGAPLGPAAIAMIGAAQRSLLHCPADFAALAPIAADELAAAFPEPDLARQLVQGMVLVAIADDRPEPARMAAVGRFAAAMGVDEPGLAAIRHLADEHMLMFRLDFYRRWHIRDIMKDQRRRGGLSGLIKGIAGLKGLYADSALAARYHALGELPTGTLGRAFHDHYQANGFAFPGEKHGFPEAGVYHDFTHVLSGYGTTPADEVLVAAFIAGYRRSNPYFVLLFAMLTFGAGMNMTPALQPVVHSALAEDGLADRFFEALRRGGAMQIDLSANWNFWPWVEKPLEQARAELNIPAPAAGYSAAA
jgi:hypothetical protein